VDRRPEELREEIADTRERIAETLQALDEKRDLARGRAAPALAALAGLLVLLWLIRRRR
jgi:hypothetical protein